MPFDLRAEVVADLAELATAFQPLDAAGQPADVDAAVTLPTPFGRGVNNGTGDGADDVREPTAVWVYTGRHTGPFLGFVPTGAPVTITGVTVFRRPEDTPSGDVECHRVIDWLDVLGQIGVTLQSRSVAATVDP
jgi:hypothetical protein